MLREQIEKDHQNYRQPYDFRIPFWSHLLEFFRVIHVSFETSFSEPSRGTERGEGRFGRGGRENVPGEPKNAVEKGAKMMPNNLPIHNQSTQVLLTVFINPCKS